LLSFFAFVRNNPGMEITYSRLKKCEMLNLRLREPGRLGFQKNVGTEIILRRVYTFKLLEIL